MAIETHRESTRPRCAAGDGVNDDGVGAWYVSGLIDGELVTARWDPVARRVCETHPEVLRRAELVVALGDQFAYLYGGRSIAASLTNGPGPALLTVIRAIGNVLSIELEFVGDAPDHEDAVVKLGSGTERLR